MLCAPINETRFNQFTRVFGRGNWGSGRKRGGIQAIKEEDRGANTSQTITHTLSYTKSTPYIPLSHTSQVDGSTSGWASCDAWAFLLSWSNSKGSRRGTSTLSFRNVLSPSCCPRKSVRTTKKSSQVASDACRVEHLTRA